jgi:hypothetical protein
VECRTGVLVVTLCETGKSAPPLRFGGLRTAKKIFDTTFSGTRDEPLLWQDPATIVHPHFTPFQARKTCRKQKAPSRHHRWTRLPPARLLLNSPIDNPIDTISSHITACSSPNCHPRVQPRRYLQRLVPFPSLNPPPHLVHQVDGDPRK